MPQPIEQKKYTAAEIRRDSKKLAKNINRKGDWIPNPKYRPGDLNSNEPPMVPNPERKKDKPRAKASAEKEREQLRITKEKARKARIARLQRETAAKADKGREARKAESEKPRGITVPTTRVKVEDPPPLSSGVTTRPGARGAIRRDTPPTEEDSGGHRTKKQQIAEALQAAERKKRATAKLIKSGALGESKGPERMATIDETMGYGSKGPRGMPRARDTDTKKLTAIQRLLQKWREEDDTEAPDMQVRRPNQRTLTRLVEKTGGKLSKSKGGTVKKMHGGTLHKKKKTKTTHTKKTKKTYGGHHGSKYVAKLYD